MAIYIKVEAGRTKILSYRRIILYKLKYKWENGVKTKQNRTGDVRINVALRRVRVTTVAVKKP
jgi:hypothetical protein